MNYSLIVSDFDGTLLRSDGTVGKRTVDAITRYREAGGVFAVCTGRMLSAILPEVKKLNLSGLVIAFNGSVISDIQTGEILRFDGFTPNEAADVCEKLEKKNLRLHAYAVDTLYVNYSDEYLSYYEKVCHVKGIRKEKLSAFLRDSSFTVHKLVIMVEEEKQKELFASIREEFSDYYVTTSAGILIELAPKGQDKGSAMEFLSSYYHIPLPNSIALGDQLNDLPMIQKAGLGIAVGNAKEELKKKSDLVTLKNDEDAVGVTIEKFGMGEKI